MPTSNLYLWGEILALIDQVPHGSLVDIGPGHGKAATLLREYLNDPPTRIDAIEAHGPYIVAHRLGYLYDGVIHADAVQLAGDAFAPYDVVLMADVIEHMEKADALALLARIAGRVVISTPEMFFSNGPGLPDSETHRSHWTEDDWTAVAKSRPLEVCYQSCGGWLVRLGPLP